MKMMKAKMMKPNTAFMNKPIFIMPLAAHKAYQRHDDIVGERGNDFAEGGTDDDTNGQVEHVAFGNKFFEFRNKAHCCKGLKGEKGNCVRGKANVFMDKYICLFTRTNMG